MKDDYIICNKGTTDVLCCIYNVERRLTSNDPDQIILGDAHFFQSRVDIYSHEQWTRLIAIDSP